MAASHQRLTLLECFLSILSAQKVSEAANERSSAEIGVRQEALLEYSCSETIVKILE